MSTHASTAESRQQERNQSRRALETTQLERLNQLLAAILPTNPLYQEKLGQSKQGAPLKIDSLEQLSTLPVTTKQELLPADPEGLARNLTYPVESYTRYHQTSGTSGRPLPVLDTARDWEWWNHCWQHVLDAADITSQDRAMLAFSFGPFIGFWTAFDALTSRQVLTLPGGGLSSLARLEMLIQRQATVLLGTPTYALHLAEVARKHGIDIANSAVRKIIVAGEPGGSLPTVRQRLESAWGATVIDHSGASEVGAWGYGDAQGTGLRVIETEFIAEFLSTETGKPAADGELAHLVLTSLGRYGCPVIRYQTGDLVRPCWVNSHRSESKGETFVQLTGGILGRADDMMVIRGVNIFPSSIEEILRGFPEVNEFRLTARKRGEMDELAIELEDQLGEPQRIAEALQLRLGLNVDVQLAAAGSLPRAEGKSMRFVDLRQEPAS